MRHRPPCIDDCAGELPQITVSDTRIHRFPALRGNGIDSTVIANLNAATLRRMRDDVKRVRLGRHLIFSGFREDEVDDVFRPAVESPQRLNWTGGPRRLINVSSTRRRPP